jgi:UDP-2-acetamido-2-deoxy-ribo-hexuluronate aminotransferase
MNIPMYTPLRDYQLNKERYQAKINQVLDHGIFINGPEITELEQKLAKYVGVDHCITMANGTDALLVALMALGVKPGDSVITVAHTWISTAEVISVLGAIPVFVDINPDTFLMDLNEIDRVMGYYSDDDEKKRPVGIIYVSLYGQMEDPVRICEMAKKWGLWVIDDGAQAFGAEFKSDQEEGQTVIKCGSWGDVSCTSFFPSKPLGGYGDSGACFTKSKAMADKLKAIKSHGGLRRFEHQYVGLNARMDTLQAAILLVKLEEFESERGLARRREIANFYDRELSGVRGLIIPKRTCKHDGHAWAQYSLLVDRLDLQRDVIVETLKTKGIHVAVFYPKGLHQQVAFGQVGMTILPDTEWVCDHVLNLPLFPELTDEELNWIVQVVKEIFA